jgi:hypothetical protein
MTADATQTEKAPAAAGAFDFIANNFSRYGLVVVVVVSSFL